MDESILPIPGLEVLGRGIILRNVMAYSLKERLFDWDGKIVRYQSTDAGKTFGMPALVAVNSSPPIPGGDGLGQTRVFDSWEHLNQDVTLDIKAATGKSPFSIDVSNNSIRNLRTEERAVYALRRNFVPFWELYLPDGAATINPVDLSIPHPFDRRHKESYEQFFQRYGTHVVKRVWVGGKALVVLSIRTSSHMSTEEIRQSVNVSTPIASSSGSKQNKSTREKLMTNADISVSGEGGDKVKLGALKDLDVAGYNQWLATIKDNPKVIEMEVTGIWNLLAQSEPEKAEALAHAYKASAMFKPISAMIMMPQGMGFLYGNKALIYDIEQNKVVTAGKLHELMPGLPSEIKTIDAAVSMESLGDYRNKHAGKLYFFCGRFYLRYDLDKKRLDPGYPKPIDRTEGLWAGIPFDRVDAALNWGDGTVYFFSGSQYCRYDLKRSCFEAGYPRPIKPHWSGITFDRIDAIGSWDGETAYFFRGNEYIRYDMVEFQAEPGFPKILDSGYIEDWFLA